MPLSLKERRALFDSQLASGPFLGSFIPKLQRIYQKVFAETADLHLGAYAGYVRPHLRRARAEVAFVEEAKKCGMRYKLVRNRSEDSHAVLLRGRIVATLSKCDSPLSPPRDAEFRNLYAGYSSFGQVKMSLFTDEPEEEAVEISDQDQPVYVIIAHGRKPDEEWTLGFVHANFVAPGGRRYMGPGIDLLSLYAGKTTDDVEHVAEPEPTLLEDEGEQAGAAT